jgi:hypothetical protein
MQGRPPDSGSLVLIYAAPSSLALSFQYHEDGGPNRRPPSIQIVRRVLSLLGLETRCIAHRDCPYDSSPAKNCGPIPVRPSLSWSWMAVVQDVAAYAPLAGRTNDPAVRTQRSLRREQTICTKSSYHCRKKPPIAVAGGAPIPHHVLLFPTLHHSPRGSELMIHVPNAALLEGWLTGQLVQGLVRVPGAVEVQGQAT